LLVAARCRYDSHFTLAFMQAAFTVAGGGLLPQLLAFSDMSNDSVWRVSSVIMAIRIPPDGRNAENPTKVTEMVVKA
jgi:hypothetical protein